MEFDRKQLNILEAKIQWLYVGMAVSILLVVFCGPIASALVPWDRVGAASYSRSPDTVSDWAQAIRWMGLMAFSWCSIERLVLGFAWAQVASRE